MSDESPRPAPQYGEYATPEQQQERIRLSGGAAQAPSAAGPAPAVAPAPVLPPATVAGAREEDAARPRRRRADRFLTWALLGYGLVTVVTTIPQLIDFSVFAQTWLDMAGIDAEFTQGALGRQWGTIAAVIFAVGWIATAAFSWLAIGRGWLSWWIPLAGAFVTFAIVSVCLSVPLFNDPSIMSAVLRGS